MCITSFFHHTIHTVRKGQIELTIGVQNLTLLLTLNIDCICYRTKHTNYFLNEEYNEIRELSSFLFTSGPYFGNSLKTKDV